MTPPARSSAHSNVVSTAAVASTSNDVPSRRRTRTGTPPHGRNVSARASISRRRDRKMGTVAAHPSSTELLLRVAFGVLGDLMRCWHYPVAPMIVGLILGPMAEGQVRRALQVSLGDTFVFFKHPASATLLVLTALALVAPLEFKGLRRFKSDDA